MAGPAPLTLCFDVYGTLVDPAGMAVELAADVGAEAADLALVWREKQVEYAFRRGLMANYVSFAEVTRQALAYAFARIHVPLTPQRQAQLLAAYARLPAFTDAEAALIRLKTAGHRLFAFSNGTVRDVTAVLAASGLDALLDGVISVDDLRTFKPAPAVYAHARRASGAWGDRCWLISGNAWDVIGARSAGLEAGWVKRQPAQVFDPWGIEPTLVVGDLGELADRLATAG
jgi:2-haloacid dehalogenase